MAQNIRDVQKGRGNFRTPTNRQHPHDSRILYGQRQPSLMLDVQNTHHGQAHTDRMLTVQ